MKIMKRVLLISLFISIAFTSWAQESTVIEAKGVGLKREDALQDALRNAVGQAVGITVSSQTQVENFMVLSDAISSKTEGYITNYEIIKETPFKDRFEIDIKASVSLSPLKADVDMLSRAIGGVRFLAMYDPRNVPADEIGMYDFATERINEALANRKYRYIEKSRFDALNYEAKGMFHDGSSGEESYVQHIGFRADAQFIIKLNRITVSKRSEAFDTRTASKVLIELKAYDNCTAEGLGTTLIESDWASGRDAESTLYSSIASTIEEKIDELFKLYISYIGDWVNNGTPYELRFYASGSYRDFRDIRNKLKVHKDFGGQMEIVSFDNYTKLNCTFSKKPDDLADAILDISDEVPFFKEKEMDVRLIFGRQISFAPRKESVPELDKMKEDYQREPAPIPAEEKQKITTEKTIKTPELKSKNETKESNKKTSRGSKSKKSRR
jgi:hypothetical protein